jgi:hypothetical protein
VDGKYASADDWWEPGPALGELHDARRRPVLLRRLNLLPKDLAARRRASRLSRWLWTGTAAAVAVIAADGFRNHVRLDAARGEADVYASQITELNALKGKGDRLAVVMGAMRELESAIAREVGVRVDLRACMHELSRITPESIRFDGVRFSREQERTLVRLTGCAFSTREQNGRAALEPFIDSLRTSPLFDDVVLGNVHKGSLGGREGQVFEANFVAVAAPEPERPTRTAAAGGGAE